MPDVYLDTLVVPSPSVYDATDPHQQQENLAYVRLQEYALLQAQHTTDASAWANLWSAQTAKLQDQSALYLKYVSLFPNTEEQDILNTMRAENTELLTLTQSPGNYRTRETALANHDQTVQMLVLKLMWQDYRYNGQEIDIDVLKMILFGRNMIISPG